jgi:hypothetical protein
VLSAYPVSPENRASGMFSRTSDYPARVGISRCNAFPEARSSGFRWKLKPGSAIFRYGQALRLMGLGLRSHLRSISQADSRENEKHRL